MKRRTLKLSGTFREYVPVLCVVIGGGRHAAELLNQIGLSNGRWELEQDLEGAGEVGNIYVTKALADLWAEHGTAISRSTKDQRRAKRSRHEGATP